MRKKCNSCVKKRSYQNRENTKRKDIDAFNFKLDTQRTHYRNKK